MDITNNIKMSKRIIVKKVNQKKQKIDDLFIEEKTNESSNISEKLSTKLVIKEETYKIIRQDDKKIQYIVHLADIHIKNNERHKEYRHVFKNLINKLNELKLNNDNSVVVICGDIGDEKQLTADAHNLLKDLFIQLTDITTVCFILGNHDIDTMSSTLDSVSVSVCKAFKTTNPIHFFNNNCVYLYNNIQFGATLMTYSTNNVTQCKKQDNIVNIGLYHGLLKGYGGNNKNYTIISNNSGSFNVSTSNTGKFSMTDFKKANYDYVLLGDYHEHIYLDKEKTVWYAGSLIQQSRSEKYGTKGFVLLDLLNETSEHIKINDDYGMVDISIDENGITNIDETFIFPKYADILVKHKCDKSLVEAFYKKIQDDGINIISHSENHDNSDFKIDTYLEIKDEKINITEIRESEKIIDLIINMMDKDMKDEMKDEIKSIIKETLETTEIKGEFKCKKVELMSMEFNNIMIYGKDNKIDFTLFKDKVVGLNDANNAGK